eukprot:333464-Amphidinium_carterae.1
MTSTTIVDYSMQLSSRYKRDSKTNHQNNGWSDSFGAFADIDTPLGQWLLGKGAVLERAGSAHRFEASPCKRGLSGRLRLDLGAGGVSA